MSRLDDHGAPLISAHGIGHRFAGRVVLEDIDLAVHAGEIVTLIGPNGSGKSTLVRVALGLIVPDTGAVERRDGLRIGYMPQSLSVDRTLPLTVRRFLAMARRRGRHDIDAALAEVGVGYAAEFGFQDLSGGEAKRVMLARALLQDPDLLVLDEPTASMDIAGQSAFYDLIRDIRDRRRCGVLLVSHDLHLVMAATDFVLCLNRHICCSGTPEAVNRHPEYLALFGASAAGAVGVYAHAHDHGHDHGHDLGGEAMQGKHPPAVRADE